MDWVGRLREEVGGGGLAHSSVTEEGVLWSGILCWIHSNIWGVSIQPGCCETVSARFHEIMLLCYENVFTIAAKPY